MQGKSLHNNGKEYILYMGQQANFQTRSMLIPAPEFLSVRSDYYDLLKQNSVKNHQVMIDGKYNTIDNILIQNYIWEGNMGTAEQRDYTEICGKMSDYADGGLEDDCYFDLKDKQWYDTAQTNLCSGFNHVKNYVKCKELLTKQGFNIIDGFLVLEADNGKLNTSDIESTDELLLFLLAEKLSRSESNSGLN
jgi:hypothetical protein